MDDIIKFDTAKLAYEKKFDWPCFHYFTLDGKLHEPYLENGSSTDTDFRVDLEDLRYTRNRVGAIYQNFYAAPPQSTLRKWLREVHNIHINIKYDGNDEVFRVEIIKQNIDGTRNILSIKDREYIIEFNSYEEALEKGLQESLKSIVPQWINPNMDTIIEELKIMVDDGSNIEYTRGSLEIICSFIKSEDDMCLADKVIQLAKEIGIKEEYINKMY